MKNILFILLLYLVINNPIFSFVGMAFNRMAFIPCIIFLMTGKKRQILSLFKKEGKMLIIIGLYLAVRVLLGADMEGLWTFITELMDIMVLLTCGIMLTKKKEFEKYLFIVGAIGAVISLACFFNPTFCDIVRSLQVLGTNITQYRYFGLSSGLTAGYGHVQVIIFFISISIMNKNKHLYIIGLLIILSAFINVRTSIIMFVALLIIHFLCGGFSGKSKILAVTIAAILFFSGSLFEKIISYNDTTEWIYSSVKEVDQFVDDGGANDGTIVSVMEMAKVLPSTTIGLIFGDGISNPVNIGRESTDVGYNKIILYGGVVYLIMWLCLIFYLFRYFFIRDKELGISFVVVFIIGTFKGAFIPYSLGLNLFALIYIYIKLKNSRKIVLR